MSDELYFLLILDEALNAADTQASLKKAFEQIQRLGHQPRYQGGYKNFICFLTEAFRRHGILKEDRLYQFLLDIALPMKELSVPKEVLLKMIESLSLNPTEYDEINEMIEQTSDQTECPIIDIFCNRNKIGTLELSWQAPRQSIHRIVPGDYIMKLDTGWILWQGPLTDKDLLWKKTVDEKYLKLAADSEDRIMEPSRRVPLLGGQIVMLIFTGIESGTIELQRGDVNGNE